MVVRRYPRGNVEIRIYRPTLTDEERERREGFILSALQQIGRSIVETRRDTNGDNDKTGDIREK